MMMIIMIAINIIRTYLVHFHSILQGCSELIDSLMIMIVMIMIVIMVIMIVIMLIRIRTVILIMMIVAILKMGYEYNSM